ncbi:Baseplate J family protein [Desulforamulus reducens MI-1]|uniref:Baseplate J family protein n=1 Tax=Desulforamulus reducens (strain ATCC BAA-1160 / DSM 100696 / MI-1) TaxID=349161 RepID=A4J3V1_DESRM|nr:baseplate J/gp47 family protein [Desulforamulus reducens]ABO49754.1 Baseplate J family protein [Desulforamulus reducens MI-1]
MTVPRFNLPDISFTEKSATQIEADFLAAYKSLTGQVLGDADPRRKFIQALIPIIAQQRVLIDNTGKQNLISYAVDNSLDHIGALTETSRLQATYATATERFTLLEAQVQAYTIPVGSRVTAGDNVFWATTEPLVIPAGQLTGDVQVQCQTIGAAGNGYLPGHINQLVDPLPYVVTVSNITESEGGIDIEANDPYAERIHEALESFSTAGPEGAYEYWAKTASQTIIDVYSYSPSPGVVEIRPLIAGGEMPGQEIIDAVNAICSNKNIRPLTDFVQVVAPEQISYDISLTYWINSENAAAAEGIQASVDKVVDEYKLWQKSKLGRDIDPSELNARIKNAGAKRVALVLPAYQKLDRYQVASERTVTVIYGGLEDE